MLPVDAVLSPKYVLHVFPSALDLLSVDCRVDRMDETNPMINHIMGVVVTRDVLQSLVGCPTVADDPRPGQDVGGDQGPKVLSVTLSRLKRAYTKIVNFFRVW